MELRGSLQGGQVSPVFTALPLGLLGSVLLFDLGVVVSGAAYLAEVSYWVLTAALSVGLLVATGLLVNLTSGTVGATARRVTGVVTAAMTGAMIAFALVWWLRTDGSAGVTIGALLFELFAFGVGVAGASYAQRASARDDGPVEPLGLAFFSSR